MKDKKPHDRRGIRFTAFCETIFAIDFFIFIATASSSDCGENESTY